MKLLKNSGKYDIAGDTLQGKENAKWNQTEQTVRLRLEILNYFHFN